MNKICQSVLFLNLYGTRVHHIRTKLQVSRLILRVQETVSSSAMLSKYVNLSVSSLAIL